MRSSSCRRRCCFVADMRRKYFTFLSRITSFSFAFQVSINIAGCGHIYLCFHNIISCFVRPLHAALHADRWSVNSPSWLAVEKSIEMFTSKHTAIEIRSMAGKADIYRCESWIASRVHKLSEFSFLYLLIACRFPHSNWSELCAISLLPAIYIHEIMHQLAEYVAQLNTRLD